MLTYDLPQALDKAPYVYEVPYRYCQLRSQYPFINDEVEYLEDNRDNLSEDEKSRLEWLYRIIQEEYK